MQPTESKRRKPDTFTKPSRSQTLAFALRFLKTRAQDPCLTWPNGKSLQQRACAGIHNSHSRDPARHTAWQLQAAGQMHQLFPPARLVVYDLRIRVAGPRRVTRPATNRATIGTGPMDDNGLSPPLDHSGKVSRPLAMLAVCKVAGRACSSSPCSFL